jgi:hypothetical protein
MLRRSSFKRPAYVAPPPAPVRPATRTATYAGSTSGEPVEKDVFVRSETYRRLVAQLPCKHCGIAGFSQAAHPNTGKGAGLKTDDRECFPLCTVHPNAAGGLVGGCHERFDQGALYDKTTRRMVEQAWAADTRRQIKAAGQWPANLPPLREGEDHDR